MSAPGILIARIEAVLAEHRELWSARREMRRRKISDGAFRGRPSNTPASFWLKVAIAGPDDCWPWRGHTRGDYGRYSEKSKHIDAHRYAWIWSNNYNPTRQQFVMHRCNNKKCCNPSHLELGDAQINTADAYKDGLAKSGEEHHRARLTAGQVLAIRGDRRRQVDVAADHGIGQPLVSAIKTGKIWKHLEG
ncbi:HNH endonuclease [Methylobacterium sp. 17Sr1-1]|uniref:HNH endonuclease n=1 Tax=Methylobacterium sp. 17Sr1-1 TaxID=2202826 RepID=UPI000D6F070C|nr:HNH endonuclease [Methylobacterium sp. 17Sr1-1]AWN55034.1 hypothetical protein DK412_28280 [Methylobacterium sp. 17Sr1-1]